MSAAWAAADRGLAVLRRLARWGPRSRYARLRHDLDKALIRLDAQDAAWSAWRAANGRQPARPQRHLTAVP